MTTEQREAIEKIERQILIGKCEKAIGIPVYISDLDTVLSLIKEQEKQINLMADFMYKTGTGRRALSCMFRQNDKCNENGCRYCIKQYFERKVEDVKD